MELDADAMMNKIKELLFQEMTKISFSTYIQPLSIESIDNSNIIFQCDSHYVKDLVETRYASLILNTIQFITNKEYTFSVHALDLDTTEQKKENEIIGYIGLWFLGDQCQITTIATDQKYQGQGYASQLMEYTLEKSEALHYQNVNLEVRVSNVKAIALYEKFGFKNVAIRKRYYSNGEDAYLMIKELEG